MESIKPKTCGLAAIILFAIEPALRGTDWLWYTNICLVLCMVALSILLERKEESTALQALKENFQSNILFSLVLVAVAATRYASGEAVMACGFLVLVILSLPMELYFRKKHYNRLFSELENEKERLARIQGVTILDNETSALLDDRIRLINELLLSKVSASRRLEKKTQEEIEKILSDKDAFVSSIAIVFSASHPTFISHLHQAGLNNLEAGYCCLLAQGLSAKEISLIFNFPGFYKLSSSIRAKLGLGPNDTNLAKYLSSKLGE